jgi:hypothetical protein
MGRRLSRFHLKHLAGIYKKGLRECLGNVSQGTQSSGVDVNRGLQEYDAWNLLTPPLGSVKNFCLNITYFSRHTNISQPFTSIGVFNKRQFDVAIKLNAI